VVAGKEKISWLFVVVVVVLALFALVEFLAVEDVQKRSVVSVPVASDTASK